MTSKIREENLFHALLTMPTRQDTEACKPNQMKLAGELKCLTSSVFPSQHSEP
jgi:hypothetical protein